MSVRLAFIAEVAPGATATQRRYGIPASVTIAQAIDESGWGLSNLATRDHNLFGIKGTGPGGSDHQRTQEYENGRLVTRAASFRVYHNIGESIADHGRLLATSKYYRKAMAERGHPNAFAAALTGVYATDPGYGAKLIRLMRQYDLYRYDVPPAGPQARQAGAGTARQARAAHQAGTAHQVGTAEQAGSAVIPGAPSGTGASTQRPGPHRPARASRHSHAPSATRRQEAGSTAYEAGSTAFIAVPAPDATARHPHAGRTSVASTGQTGPAIDRAPGSATSPPPVSAPPVSRAGVRPIRSLDPPARGKSVGGVRYQHQIPPSVKNAFVVLAKAPLLRAEPLYREVAAHRGIPWQVLAACDWMQCDAHPRLSPVYGEKLGAVNPDGTSYRTKSAALSQCADDLADLAWAVYRVDLSGQDGLSVGDLANAFAAFRWGELLKRSRTSAMEFPYSVGGLTSQHMNMRWPDIDDVHTPDRPGTRFRRPFGAVPAVLTLDYPAIA